MFNCDQRRQEDGSGGNIGRLQLHVILCSRYICEQEYSVPSYVGIYKVTIEAYINFSKLSYLC